jgi:hypothetical protein
MTATVPFAEYQRHDRRLTLLRGLDVAAGYTANTYLLQRYLDAAGHLVSRDVLAADVAWRAEQGLVTQDQRPTITVVTATARGLDVATGRATVPGVARPNPVD